MRAGASTSQGSEGREDARDDGKWMLRTNTDLSARELALKYKQLWTVEAIFRTMKSQLDTRPIFHKTDDTIRGHVFCSFLALVLREAQISGKAASSAASRCRREGALRKASRTTDSSQSWRRVAVALDTAPEPSPVPVLTRGGKWFSLAVPEPAEQAVSQRLGHRVRPRRDGGCNEC